MLRPVSKAIRTLGYVLGIFTLIFNLFGCYALISGWLDSTVVITSREFARPPAFRSERVDPPMQPGSITSAE